MRVLHLIDSLVSGGKERQFVELLKGLKREPDIACHAVVMSDVIEYEEFHGFEIPATILPRRSRHDLSIFSRLLGVLREFRPSIVQSWNSMCSIYAAPAAKWTGAKFIDGFVRSAVPNVSFRDQDYFRSRLTMPFTDVVVGNSMAGLAAYRIPARKAVCIYNGFDTGRVANLKPIEQVRHELGITTRHVVGMTAAFSPRKDYATYFEAARRIHAMRSDVTFLAIGAGEQLQHFETALPPESWPRIRLLGRRSDVEDITNLFTAGVLATNTSVHGEGLSNALMECMALAKPVIATDFGGNRELVRDGENGFLVGTGDSAALSERILRLLDDEAFARKMGQRGKQRMEAEFLMTHMTANYFQLYCRLVGQAR